MTTPAKDWAEELLQRWRSAGYVMPHGEIESAVKRDLASALRKVREEALEEAANVCEDDAHYDLQPFDVAPKIRSLIGKEGG